MERLSGLFFFFQAEDGIRDLTVTGVQTCALPIWLGLHKLAKLMADRNKEDRVSWLYVQPLPAQLGSFAGNIKLKVPKAGLSEIHPVDLADILEELEAGQRVALFNALDADPASATP